MMGLVSFWRSFIGLQQKFHNEMVQSEKKIIFRFNFFIFEFTRERIKLQKRF